MLPEVGFIVTETKMLFGSFVMYVAPGRAVSITSASYRAAGDAGYCRERAGPVVGLGVPVWRSSRSDWPAHPDQHANPCGG